MYIRFSNRLLKASSMSQGKFVAASTMTTFCASVSDVFPDTPNKQTKTEKLF